MARIVDSSFQKITGGPGKFDLMQALFAGKEVTFTLENGQKLAVRISSIQREDGSNESWNLEGWFTHVLNNRAFKAYYATSGNHGTLRPTTK